jgi:6,7-dimethyl-8-ribityllumazine synthase
MAQDVRSANRKEPTARGEGLRIAIVCGRFNDHITDRLLEGAVPALTERGVRGPRHRLRQQGEARERRDGR